MTRPELAARGEPEALTDEQLETVAIAAARRARERERTDLRQRLQQAQRKRDWLISPHKRRDVRSALTALDRSLAAFERLIGPP
jgi:hypothetical protein